MKKFVIEYATGEYDSFYEHIYAMEAESETDIQLWILAGIEEAKLNRQEWAALQDTRYKDADWHLKVGTFLKENPLYTLNVNGYKLAEPDDIYYRDVLNDFLITELDVWFEKAKPLKVKGL